MTKILVAFPTEQAAQRALYLIHRDLCRVEGSIVLARERLDEKSPNFTTAGSQRRQAHQTLDSAPDQAKVLRGAHRAIEAGLRQAREAGEIG